jgi:hypothetical protein
MTNMKHELKEGEDYYFNEQGFLVFTETYHLKKGYCCGNGCLHCPFEYDAVPEPRKSELMAQKKLRDDSSSQQDR